MPPAPTSERASARLGPTCPSSRDARHRVRRVRRWPRRARMARATIPSRLARSSKGRRRRRRRPRIQEAHRRFDRRAVDRARTWRSPGSENEVRQVPAAPLHRGSAADDASVRCTRARRRTSSRTRTRPPTRRRRSRARAAGGLEQLEELLIGTADQLDENARTEPTRDVDPLSIHALNEGSTAVLRAQR